ncbi:MAG: transposase [Flavobacteriales bacterium]|jgi:hypothetical protein|nr:transposase [Flavobacteriales bacterium]MBK6893204.1 transposase [Flavobacteriales bacterium]MBK7249063.1 transposase [Flavobacteriales bacterium]MBK7285639.1 transposase [Flavobacteriales bacterium]MBK9058686.1 transposase [Flavobacteriales bacterium]
MDLSDLFFDPHKELEITSRIRPHWKQAGTIHFVTWRMADSLPQVQLRALENDRRLWREKYGSTEIRTLDFPSQREYYRLFDARVQQWLDAGAGSCALRQAGPRQELVNALHFFNGIRYQLGSFAVAGNHVHVLVVPFGGHDLSAITHSWKSYTAKSINKLLGRTGTFWKEESFDHLVRNERSLSKFEDYIATHERQGAYVERTAFA